ncbi:ABC transporter ATP-binding protein [Patulibacter defluvii]|uniref:ABC transporter ATP-binding protein n=1 Tax=Patulibacter defluvii TaxID=3095358 RepID=UPI002A751473|nr:ABC transporter ATP-binding protein [Patulibacter sp. DM4]
MSAAPPSASGPPALEARDLRKTYRGGREALRGIDLRVGPGELVGLLGPNGAGKTTLTKIACGLVHPTGGAIAVAGHPAGSAPARRAIGYLAELFRFPDWLTADEVLALHQRLARSDGGAEERARRLADVGLGDSAGLRVAAMSKGMQQRLGIAQALLGAPRLVLLDEPTSALDPVGRAIVRDLLTALRERGIGVLLSSHLLGEVERVCDRVAIVVDGRVVADGAPQELTRPAGVELETDRGTRLVAGATRDDVPELVARAVADGERVYGVAARRSTLEDVYRDAVGESADAGVQRR